MAGRVPFVVVVASEKGGVGKTTIATNLAVYLKALHEDLPVTIASFDNHFSVDAMFAIRRATAASVAELFAGRPARDLVDLGEYGVQYLASERQLLPPDDDPLHLKRVLRQADLDGIFILDTRPILDYFTRSALLAADLVLVPVKDRPSLVNAASLLHEVRAAGGATDKFWLLPSLIDSRLRLREHIGVREFLVESARERGYQVLDTFISKSPKVESLTTNLSSRVYPVLTHARNTAVHTQFRQLGDFVLRCRQTFVSSPAQSVYDPSPTGMANRLSRRQSRQCPLCGESADGSEGGFFQDLRSRRQGFIHGGCLQTLVADSLLEPLPDQGTMVWRIDEEALHEDELCFSAHLFEEGGDELVTDQISLNSAGCGQAFLQATTGRPLAELYRETLMLFWTAAAPREFLSQNGRRALAGRRKKMLREVYGRL
ncbi:MAG: ParA family protein [Desulfuromonadales bacterium]